MNTPPETIPSTPTANTSPRLCPKAIVSVWLGMLLPGLAAVAALFALLTPLAQIGDTPFVDHDHPIILMTTFFATIAALLGGPAGWVAVVVGHLARREIRRSGGTLRGNRHALIGLIGGYLSVAALILSILIPVIHRALSE